MNPVMQCTNTQVLRSMEALREQPVETADAVERVVDRTDASPVTTEIVERLSSMSPIRQDRLEEVRSRLEDGSLLPSVDEVAEKLVGRLVCDRLR